MTPLMRGFMHMLVGSWELLRLAASSGFRFRGRYWRWRMETAFGRDATRRPSLLARWRAAIDYGAWVHRMRRYARR